MTKYRRDMLNGAVLDAWEAAMRKVCGDFGVELREFNGEDDHVRLLVQYLPKVAFSALVTAS